LPLVNCDIKSAQDIVKTVKGSRLRGEELFGDVTVAWKFCGNAKSVEAAQGDVMGRKERTEEKTNACRWGSD